MTIDEFFSLLQQYKTETNAKHSPCDTLKNQLFLRTPEGVLYCPLTFVAGIKNHCYYSLCRPRMAGEELDLESEDITKLIRASEGLDLNSPIRKRLEEIIKGSETSLVKYKEN